MRYKRQIPKIIAENFSINSYFWTEYFSMLFETNILEFDEEIQFSLHIRNGLSMHF